MAGRICEFCGNECGAALSIVGMVPAEGPAKVAYAPCLDGRDAATALRAALGLPVLVLNGADAFAWPRTHRGQGEG